MATAFEDAHRDQIQGTLTAVDRLIVHGHLRAFWHSGGGGLASFLVQQGIPVVKGFGRYVHAASERIRLHASEIARRTGRPFIYQDRVVRGKDDLAREIARRDGISKGLICVFSTLELATCFALVRGRIAPRLRKCLHFYFYLIDPELGFMHVRLQSWFPFQIQIYVNGREWLARQLTKKGIGHIRYENTFVQVDDLGAAQRICQTFARRPWRKVFNAFARRVNPLLPLIENLGFGPYYWAIDACEVAADVMWTSRKGLRLILDDLFDYALRTFSADDVVRFLGFKFQPSKAEVASYHQHFAGRGDTQRERRRRPDCRRLKHRIRHNWIKLYDKWSVLRVETVINRPYDFRTLRVDKDRKGRKRYRYVAMTKSLHNLWRFIQVGEAANRRYLNALAAAQPIKRTIADLDSLCRGRMVDGARCPRINPVAPDQHQIFQAVLAGEHTIQGLRNRDLQARLYSLPANSTTQARSRCSRVSRIISKLRGHGLLAKVPGSRLYRVTDRGHRVMGLAIRFRQLESPTAMTA
jgi:hypothetical protein